MNKKDLKNIEHISILDKKNLQTFNLFELILVLTPKIRKIKKWISNFKF